ncbi:MAG: helix-turn-helix transcriptional regulator [Clostridia bacterium]|nr:helix-turn-helix transcriptional regulator [Clostridia bacterium]MDD4387332.1 helix-turn-helix transcriptional regulator [Clostridia bacterium]
MDENNLSDNISILRKQNNMSQEVLAEKLNVSRQAVSNWETNKTQPDISTLTRMGVIFGKNIDNIVRGDFSMTLDNKKEQVDNYKVYYDKYAVATGLFWAISTFLSIGIFTIVGIIYNSSKVWIIAGISGLCTFLSFGLIMQAIMTLKRKEADKQE